jgi:putative transposase
MTRVWPGRGLAPLLPGNILWLEPHKGFRLPSRLVLLASIYMLVRLALNLVVLRASSNAELDLEILALRLQVAVLRGHVKRPELLPADRLILAALGRGLPAGRLIFSPATLLRWHRELVRRHWSAYGRGPRRGRPSISDEHKQLILRLTRENPRWGYQVAANTIRGVLRRQRVPPAPRREGPSWAQFLSTCAGAILACDCERWLGDSDKV